MIQRVVQALQSKHFETFLGGFLADEVSRLRQPRATGLRHLLVALCDHHEPLAPVGGEMISGTFAKADVARGQARTRVWRTDYPTLARRYRDADGRHPRHSFFFPGEEYRPEFLEPLAELAREGLGEVEVHLHHDGDTEATLEKQLVETLANFAKHGHLSRDPDGRLRYAFIHGNWALANARPDGRWCGVDAELPLLFRTGCYADFTFPAAPDPSQPNIVNRIYWPTGDLAQKRAFETGARAKVGEKHDDRMLIIQGPLALARRPNKPISMRIENSALTSHDPASPKRARTWVSRNIHVEGRPEWVFVKLHTHGAPEAEAKSLLGDGGHALHEVLTTEYNDGQRWKLHYVTAREMFNIARAAMDGKAGDPAEYRDYVLTPPPAAR